MADIDLKELKSLEILLGDPDPEVAQAVNNRILELGRDALDYFVLRMEMIPRSNVDKKLVRRINSLYVELILSELKREMSTPYPDLTNGLYLLTALAKPTLKREEFDQAYISVVEEVVKELNSDGTAIENVQLMNHVFFNRFGIECVKEHSQGAKSVMVDDLFHCQKGFPVSVAIAYFLVARNAGLPIYPIPTPATGFSAAYLYNDTTILAIDIGDKGKIFSVPSFIEAMRNMYPKSKLDDEQLLVAGDDKMVLGIYIESLSSFFEYENKEALSKIYDKASKIVGQRKILGN